MSYLSLSQKHLLNNKWFKFLSLIIIFINIGFFISPVRNFLLYPVWHPAWRDISSLDLLRIGAVRPPSNVTNLDSCSRIFKPAVSRNTTPFNGVSFFEDVLDKNFQLKKKEHSFFVPAMSMEIKKDTLYLYMIMAEALQKADVPFFIRGGSLLGVHRHRGIIPWDDDVDVAVPVSNWKVVREILSCTEGHRLYVNPNMHWKFKPQDKQFPFIDIFFYTQDNEYVWALTHYTRHTFIMRQRDVFPLTTGQFEGLEVPIPKNTDRILRKLYDYEICVSRSLDHQTNVAFDVMAAIPCSDLLYMYKMYHLRS